MSAVINDNFADDAVNENKRLLQILDALPAALYATDEKGRLTYYNQAAVSFSGRTPQIGTDQWCVSWRLFHTDGTPMPHDQCPMAIALKEGKIIRGAEAIAERPDGTRVPFMPFPTPLRDEHNKIVGAINMLVDLTDRKRAERDVAHSRQNFQQLVGLMPAAVYTIEAPSGRISFYNDRAAELWGRRPAIGDVEERFCGSFKLWLPDGSPLPHDQTPMAVAMVKGESFRNLNVDIERPDGSRVSVLVNIDPIRNEHGEVVGAVNVFQDITPLKQAEAEALKQSQQLSAFMETASIALHRVAADGTILWANQAELDLLGYTREEYFGRNIADFHADGKVISDIIARLKNGEKLRDYRATLRCKNGSIKSVLIDSSALWDRDRFLHTQCFTRDVTERERVSELQAQLAAIVNSSDDAIISKTLEGVITSWNAGAERMYGYTAAEAVGKNISLVIPPDCLGEEEEVLSRLKSGERIEHFETDRQTKDGERINVSLTVSPLRDTSGKIIGASKIARDITERKRAEAAMRQADQRKDEFIATLAHELRNPLAPLRNGLQILRLRGDDPETVAQTLDIMERQLGQMVRLIDDLLDIGRITTGKLQLRHVRTSLREVLDEAIEISQPLAIQKQQEIVLTVPAYQVALWGDHTRLAQIFANLLNNAVKYSPAGKRIDVTAARERRDIVISVKDRGIGIPREQLSNIFEPFLQVESQQGNTGLGIGLALVKRLVELHGGSITASSGGMNRGSQFEVRLPIVVEDAPREDHSAARSLANGCRRILVVDDNHDAAKSLAHLLSLLGHDVNVAHDGGLAVEMTEKRQPEVVLLDIGLPEMDGYEVCRRIRAISNPIIVAVTGWGQDKDRKLSAEAGFDHHLVKPVDLESLAQLLAQESR